MPSYHLGKIVFLVSVTLTLVEIGCQSHQESLTERKRGPDEYSTCRQSFEVHNDKIIRTQDSKALGARYLNERDVSSMGDCMELCCSSDNCDVFVFEEIKAPGGCYLFECGPPEDFKCKFTKYKNYTSGFLNVNRHLTELESEIKYSQHERELTHLRAGYSKQSSRTESPPQRKTTSWPNTKEVLEQYGPQSHSSQQSSVVTRRGCSRNQFECHASGECIAIYNACDGIPQCSDGSDESLELGCPASQSTISTPIRHVHPTNVLPLRQQHSELIAETAQSSENLNPEMNIPPVRKQWPGHEEYASKKIPQGLAGLYQQKPTAFGTGPNQLTGPGLQDMSRTGFGREGEELASYRAPDPLSPWGSSQYHHNQGSQIFAHKGEGLLPQNSRFQPPPHSAYIPPEQQIRSGPQYNDPGQPDYAKYYADNPQYNRMYGSQNGPVNSWQQNSKPHNMNVPEQSQGMDEMPANRNEGPPNGPYPDYYYEEMYKNKMLQQQPQLPYPPLPPTSYQQPIELPAGPQTKAVPQSKVIEKPQETTVKPTQLTLTTLAAPVEPKEANHKEADESETKNNENHSKVSHRKVDKLTAEIRLKDSLLNLEEDVHVNTPRGAVLALTMGLCVTGVMLILVGCRMRVVSKRMRRGGKGYAHDADFLVNGMYL